MIFKKIEMVGFKSFADRTVIEFGDNFTAIVGPNGCGKSNVSDAIRWVLGEQSPKTLRGDSMQDVIFNGTEKRKSLSYCEVTLTFDNSERFFNFDYDELAITRKLYRSGESEYLINRNTCRLRDITNLLYNSGLGKNGYSVVSQGKVTELVDSKPEARRAMFEDAAGISKYKNDKKEAENKLERTNDNLTRVRDILSEIERQMGPLKKQAENAKKYLEYKGQLKDLEINAYIYQYEHANDEKEKINLKLDAINRQLAQREGDLETANSNYDKAMAEINNFDKLLSSLNEKILELTIGLEKQESETKLARERVNFTLKEND
ncbi:MAG: AAA family ATPase, partial [Clostridia bacterium]|nr:AAA family ATPase [Clostridia bacterium]